MVRPRARTPSPSRSSRVCVHPHPHTPRHPKAPRSPRRRGGALVGLAVPLGEEACRVEVEEGEARLLGDRTRDHRLARAGRAVQQDPLRRPQQLGLRKQVGPLQRQQDGVLQLAHERIEPTDVVEANIDLVRDDHVGRHLDLVARRQRRPSLGLRRCTVARVEARDVAKGEERGDRQHGQLHEGCGFVGLHDGRTACCRSHSVASQRPTDPTHTPPPFLIPQV
eukprot:6898837-Prymnesium_polylepis.2